MDKYEEGRSIACIDASGSEGEPYDVFIVGTGVIRPDEDEAQRGRVMVFAGFSNGQYKEIAEGETRGAVHAIAQLPDGKFAVTSNSEVSPILRLRLMRRLILNRHTDHRFRQTSRRRRWASAVLMQLGRNLHSLQADFQGRSAVCCRSTTIRFSSALRQREQ